MVFLPGTFVASFFATPFFQWDANNDAGIVSHRFWIYWVVTIPLTLFVLGIWAIWVSAIVINYDVEYERIGRQSIDEENGLRVEARAASSRERKKPHSMLQAWLIRWFTAVKRENSGGEEESSEVDVEAARPREWKNQWDETPSIFHVGLAYFDRKEHCTHGKDGNRYGDREVPEKRELRWKVCG